ncbi:hypothetical protein PtrCC142_012140, partial [Pyrenophora tritici-repentis]
ELTALFQPIRASRASCWPPLNWLSSLSLLIDICGGRAKSKRQIRRLPRTNDEGPGERLAIDFHTYEVQAITKEKSQMLITDRFSGLQWDLYFTDNRTAKSIIRLLTTFFSFMKNHYNISVKTIESDNEITTVKPDVERWLATQGIRVEPSAPDTQAQNGGACNGLSLESHD